MITPTLEKLAPFFSSYSSSINVTPSTLIHLFTESIDFLRDQTKHFVFAGIGLSSLGSIYSSIGNNTQQWIFYTSACAICLGTAYRQGWLEQALHQAKTEIAELKKNLTTTLIALSDREDLLKDLQETKKQLQAVSDVVVTAGINEKALLAELAASKQKQEELSNIVTQLTATTLFFQNLKDTYPDPKLFLEHLSSIEKITQVTQTHLSKNNIDAATKLTELKTFLENLSKRDLDKMALLLKMDKTITSIESGVITANHSLEELKSQKANTA